MRLKLNVIVKVNIFLNERMGEIKSKFLKSYGGNMNY